MYVKRIEIAGFDDGGPDGPLAGAVTLVAGDRRMQIPLTLVRRVEILRSRNRLLVLAEALRTARRLPEFRQRGTLRFAPGVLPDRLRKDRQGDDRPLR